MKSHRHQYRPGRHQTDAAFATRKLGSTHTHDFTDRGGLIPRQVEGVWHTHRLPGILTTEDTFEIVDVEVQEMVR